MPRPLKTLRVQVNPFVILDHDGRPCARVNEDPDHHSPDNRMVGAVHKAELIEARSPIDVRTLRGDNRPSIHEHWLEYAAEPVTVPDTPYYRQRIREGTLLVASEASAKTVGQKFRDPSAVIIETARDQAKIWAREHDGEIPEWAQTQAVKDDEGVVTWRRADGDEAHASHATHAHLLAKHVEKAKAAAPPAAPPVISGAPETHHDEHEEHP